VLRVLPGYEVGAPPTAVEALQGGKSSDRTEDPIRCEPSAQSAFNGSMKLGHWAQINKENWSRIEYYQRMENLKAFLRHKKLPLAVKVR
jgi:hypothetical protein